MYTTSDHFLEQASVFHTTPASTLDVVEAEEKALVCQYANARSNGVMMPDEETQQLSLTAAVTLANAFEVTRLYYCNSVLAGTTHRQHFSQFSKDVTPVSKGATPVRRPQQ